MKIAISRNRVWEMTGAQLCELLARQLGVDHIRSVSFEGTIIHDVQTFEVRWSEPVEEREI